MYHHSITVLKKNGAAFDMKQCFPQLTSLHLTPNKDPFPNSRLCAFIAVLITLFNVVIYSVESFPFSHQQHHHYRTKRTSYKRRIPHSFVFRDPLLGSRSPLSSKLLTPASPLQASSPMSLTAIIAAKNATSIIQQGGRQGGGTRQQQIVTSTQPLFSAYISSTSVYTRSKPVHIKSAYAPSKIIDNNSSKSDEASKVKKQKESLVSLKPSTDSSTTIAKRLTKQITKCGTNYQAAFEKLFAMYPFLEFTFLEEDGTYDNHYDAKIRSMNFDLGILLSSFRPIGAMIDLLGKVNQPYLGLKLFHRILDLIQLYHQEIISVQKKQHEEEIDTGLISTTSSDIIAPQQITSFMYLLYKAIIGMIGATIPKQQRLLEEQQQQNTVDRSSVAKMNKYGIELKGEYIVKLLYHDLPMKTFQCKKNIIQEDDGSQLSRNVLSPPSIDLYHNTLSALGKCRRMDLSMKIIQDMEANKIIELPYTSSRLSSPSLENDKSTHIEQQLYTYQLPKPDRTAYATALTAAVRSKAYSESLQILQSMKQHKIYPNVLAYNQVLTCLSNSGSAFDTTNERYELTNSILNEMECSIDNSEASTDLKSDNNVEYQSSYPTEATYKIVMAIYAKENKWDDIARIKQKVSNMNKMMDQSCKRMKQPTSEMKPLTSVARNNSKQYGSSDPMDSAHETTASDTSKAIDTDTSEVQSSLILGHMSDLKKLEKMNKRRPVWYKLGKYEANQDGADDISFFFGIQTHRNPTENGLSLVFFEVETERKLGYMLIRNAIGPNPRYDSVGEEDNPECEEFLLFSKFMGMYIDENQRGKKLATKFMAIWLMICHKSNALPTTEVINKPLLSLVLTKFGFLPKDNEGSVEVEVCPISSAKDKPKQINEETGWFPEFAMYSKNIRPGDGTFGERELRIQKMMVTKYPPNPKGKKTFVKSCFDHPLVGAAQSTHIVDSTLIQMRNELEELILISLGGKRNAEFFADNVLTRRAIFGYLFECKKETEVLAK